MLENNYDDNAIFTGGGTLLDNNGDLFVSSSSLSLIPQATLPADQPPPPTARHREGRKPASRKDRYGGVGHVAWHHQRVLVDPVMSMMHDLRSVGAARDSAW